MMTAIALLLFTAFGDPDIPAALERAFMQRTSMKTAVLKYRRDVSLPGKFDFVQNAEATFVGNDVLCIDRGDDDGITLRDPTGSPMFGVRNACLPEQFVSIQEGDEAGCWWLRGSFDHLGYNNKRRPDFVDARTFGLFSREMQNQTPHELLDRLRRDNVIWREQDEPGGIKRITARYPPTKPGGPNHEYVWDIAPALDFAIVGAEQASVDAGGTKKTYCTMTATYTRNSGRWWPSRIEAIGPVNGYHAVVEFEHAEFDRPDHPTHLGVQSMGIPFGVEVFGKQAENGESSGRYLGAGRIAPNAEWSATKEQYDLVALKTFYNRQRSMGFGYLPKWWDASADSFALENVAHNPDAWEIFVRRWILKHRTAGAYVVPSPIDQKQINSAWSILKECRKQAGPIRARNDKELSKSASLIEQCQKKIDAAATKSDERSLAESRLSDARKGRALLESPAEIRSIFKRLCERLDGLLTREQKVPGAYVPPIAHP